MNLQTIVMIGIVLAVGGLPATAVENAVGRTLPGIWVMPQGGMVPKESGFSFTLMPIGYMGTIGGNRIVPIAGVLSANVSADISENLVITQYVYKSESTKAGFSSSFYLPVNWQGVSGQLQAGDVFARSTNSISRGLQDVSFSPLTAGIRFSENNNLAIDCKIWAPSGAYKPGNLSNLGMNEWTIQPNLAHTLLWKKRGLEIDN